MNSFCPDNCVERAKTRRSISNTLVCCFAVMSVASANAQGVGVKLSLVPPRSTDLSNSGLSIGIEPHGRYKTLQLTVGARVISIGDDMHASASAILERRWYVRPMNPALADGVFLGVYVMIARFSAQRNGGARQVEGAEFAGNQGGLGIVLGKQFYFSSTQRTWLELGAGAAIAYSHFDHYYSGPVARRNLSLTTSAPPTG